MIILFQSATQFKMKISNQDSTNEFNDKAIADFFSLKKQDCKRGCESSFDIVFVLPINRES